VRLFWIMSGIFLALGLLFVGGAVVFFGKFDDAGSVIVALGESTPAKDGKSARPSSRASRDGTPARAPRTDPGKETREETRSRVIARMSIADSRRAGAEQALARLARATGSDSFEPDQILAVGASPEFEATAAKLGYVPTDDYRLTALDIDLHRLRKVGNMSPRDAVSALRSRFPGIPTAVNSRYAPAALSGADPRTVAGWPPARPGCGKGLRIGVIDGAVDLGHPALAGQAVTARSFHAPKRQPAGADHGTAIVAMFVGKPSKQDPGGLVPEAEVFAAGVIEESDTGRVGANAIGLMRAIDWLARQRPHAVNVSLAGGDNDLVRLAFARARRLDLVMVAAAGTVGQDAAPSLPGALVEAISVTAARTTRQQGRFDSGPRGSYLDFAAPGYGIMTAVPGGTRVQSGTSFAAPFVTVAAAEAVTHGTRRDPDAVVATLQKSVRDLGSPGYDDVFGWGLIASPGPCGS
jgi:hypothetical protein